MISHPQKHIVREFLAALASEGINQSQFAERCGLSSAYISRFIAGARPEDPLFESICTKWDNPKLGQSIVLGHLRDEIERSGHELSEFSMQLSEANPREAALDAMMVVLKDEASKDHNVEKLLAGLHVVLMTRMIARQKVRRSKETQ